MNKFSTTAEAETKEIRAIIGPEYPAVDFGKSFGFAGVAFFVLTTPHLQATTTNEMSYTSAVLNPQNHMVQPRSIIDIVMSIAKRFRFSDNDGIYKFLISNRDVAEVLDNSTSHIERFFGVGVAINLDLVTDPEIEGGLTVVAYIQSKSDISNSLESLMRFKQDFWYAVMDNVIGSVNFGIEIVDAL